MTVIKPSHGRWMLGITTALVLVGGWPAAASVWTRLLNGNASGSWGEAANWSGGVPNGTNAVADFSTLNLAVNSTVTNDVARTVGTLKFNDATPGSSWTLTGSSLTLATGSGSPTIDAGNSNQITTLSAGCANDQFVRG